MLVSAIVSVVALVAADVPTWREIPSEARATIQDHVADVVRLPNGQLLDLWPYAERERVLRSSTTERTRYRVIDTGTGMRFRRPAGTVRSVTETRETQAWKLSTDPDQRLRRESGLPEMWMPEGERSVAEFQGGRLTSWEGDAGTLAIVDVAAFVRQARHVEGDVFETRSGRVVVDGTIEGEAYLWDPAGDLTPSSIVRLDSITGVRREEVVEAISEGRFAVERWEYRSRNGTLVWERTFVVDAVTIRGRAQRPVEEVPISPVPVQGHLPIEAPLPPVSPSPRPAPAIDPLEDPSPRDPLAEPT